MNDFSLHRAAKDGNLERAKQLIEGGASVDSRDDKDRSPLQCAAEEGHYEVAELLISSKCDLNLKDEWGRTPVLLAAMWGRKRVVELLLQHGAQVNCADEYGLLHRASGSGWADLVSHMLERGEADPNAATKLGDTPLMQAAVWGHEEVAALLLRAGADVRRRDVRKRTALHRAALWGRTRVVQVLLEAEGLDLNPQDEYYSDTPLHKACKEGCLEVVKLLLVAGADTTLKNNDGETALSVGIRQGKLTPAEVGLFVEHGASFEDRDYVRMAQNEDLKETVMKDVDLVTQSIVNKLNRQTLPELKSIAKFLEDLPSVDMLKSNAQHIRNEENSVKCDLQINTSCDVVPAEARPKVLRVVCKLAIVISLFLSLPLTLHGSAALVAKGLKYIF